MKCNEFWRRFQEEGLSEELSGHLKECSSCADEMLIDRAIDAAVAVPVAAMPSDRVWEQLELKLDSISPITQPAAPESGKLSWFAHVFPSGRYFLRLAYAVAALIVIAVGLGVYMLLPSNRDTTASEDPLAAVRDLEKSEELYLEAIETLSHQIEGRKGAIEPELYDLYMEKLAVLDSYIASCRQAVDANNDNINARLYLALAYKEKAETLKEIAGLL